MKKTPQSPLDRLIQLLESSKTDSEGVQTGLRQQLAELGLDLNNKAANLDLTIGQGRHRIVIALRDGKIKTPEKGYRQFEDRTLAKAAGYRTINYMSRYHRLTHHHMELIIAPYRISHPPHWFGEQPLNKTKPNTMIQYVGPEMIPIIEDEMRKIQADFLRSCPPGSISNVDLAKELDIPSATIPSLLREIYHEKYKDEYTAEWKFRALELRSYESVSWGGKKWYAVTPEGAEAIREKIKCRKTNSPSRMDYITAWKEIMDHPKERE